MYTVHGSSKNRPFNCSISSAAEVAAVVEAPPVPLASGGVFVLVLAKAVRDPGYGKKMSRHCGGRVFEFMVGHT